MVPSKDMPCPISQPTVPMKPLRIASTAAPRAKFRTAARVVIALTTMNGVSTSSVIVSAWLTRGRAAGPAEVAVHEAEDLRAEQEQQWIVSGPGVLSRSPLRTSSNRVAATTSMNSRNGRPILPPVA